MSKKNIIIIFVAAFVALVGFTGLWFWRGRVERPVNFSDVKRPPAPEFNLKDYEGKEVKLSDFRGKPSVINVWAGWCPFCADELTDLVKLQEEFGDKIAVIGINRGETLEAAKQFSDRAGVIGKMILLLDPSDSFYSSIGGFSMPETIFTDASGFILFHKRGPMKLEEMKRRLQQAFNL
jgi:thiol-disulfide isomerase/thioredoxin